MLVRSVILHGAQNIYNHADKTMVTAMVFMYLCIYLFIYCVFICSLKACTRVNTKFLGSTGFLTL